MTPLCLVAVLHLLPQPPGSIAEAPPSLITVPETFFNAVEVLLVVATSALVLFTLNVTWPGSK